MTATPTKKKLCWNCDGNVPLRAEHCPYCGVYIEQSADADDLDEQEDEDHAPPYAMSASKKPPTAAPAPPYSTTSKKSKVAPPEPKTARPAARSLPKEQLRKVVLPLLLLICGSVFALFGLVLLLFSDNGVFVLKWNGDHWPFYLVVGVVSLVIGWRLVGNVEEQST